MTRSDWLPKSVLALRDYSARKFSADLIAGITVGLVALPLAMAFAIAAGAPPEAIEETPIFLPFKSLSVLTGLATGASRS